MVDIASLRVEFIEHFNGSPRFFQAPGRVNLIGEHTDYNAGFVMPAAIGFYTTVAIAPRADRLLRVRSTNFAETVERKLPNLDQPPLNHTTHWVDYVLGVAQSLSRQGIAQTGADLLIHGEVPIGSGLSSSAALEVAVAMALSAQVGVELEPLTLAQLCQRAENDYVGMRCGIMDQFAAAHGRAGHAMWIDCRSLDYQWLPLSDRREGIVSLVVCNTMVRHQHASGEYNRRRAECEEGVRALAQLAPGIQALRDVSPELLKSFEAQLDPLIYRRCRHIATENERVCVAAAALRASDLQKFGQLMRESHRSLRVDYEVSCDELDLMVRLADQIHGVYGARMTGGGFGGCTVNMVRTDALEQFKTQVSEQYGRATGHQPEIYVCETADGARAIV